MQQYCESVIDKRISTLKTFCKKTTSYDRDDVDDVVDDDLCMQCNYSELNGLLYFYDGRQCKGK